MFDVCPDADLVTQAFGCTDVTSEWIDNGCASGRFHSGIDLGRVDGGVNLLGKPARFTRSGTIIKVGIATLPPYRIDPNVVTYLGDQVVVLRATDGRFLIFGHLDRAVVMIGQVVKTGEHAGDIGAKGHATAPHLHLEARTDGPYQPGPQGSIDPTPYLVDDPKETFTMDDDARRTFIKTNIATFADARGITLTDAQLDGYDATVKPDLSNLQAVKAQILKDHPPATLSGAHTH